MKKINFLALFVKFICFFSATVWMDFLGLGFWQRMGIGMLMIIGCSFNIENTEE